MWIRHNERPSFLLSITRLSPSFLIDNCPRYVDRIHYIYIILLLETVTFDRLSHVLQRDGSLSFMAIIKSAVDEEPLERKKKKKRQVVRVLWNTGPEAKNEREIEIYIYVCMIVYVYVSWKRENKHCHSRRGYIMRDDMRCYLAFTPIHCHLNLAFVIHLIFYVYIYVYRIYTCTLYIFHVYILSFYCSMYIYIYIYISRPFCRTNWQTIVLNCFEGKKKKKRL